MPSLGAAVGVPFFHYPFFLALCWLSVLTLRRAFALLFFSLFFYFCYHDTKNKLFLFASSLLLLSLLLSLLYFFSGIIQAI